MVRGGDPEGARSAGSSRLRRLVHRLRRDERGEGVISAAIAVLVMAFIGVGAFVAYKAIMGDVTKKTQDCVSAYVSDAGQCGNA
jgi:Flp pilus assembly protein TadG